MLWDLGLITICAIVMAIEPASKLVTQVRNWVHRQQVHRRSLK